MNTPKSNLQATQGKTPLHIHLHTIFHKHKFTGLGLIIAGLAIYLGIALADTEGGNSGGTFNSISFSGADVTWTHPEYTGSNDNTNYAIADLDDNEQSYYLKVTNFGFSIPDGATIDGITVNVDRQAENASRIKDDRVRIVKGGTIMSTQDKAKTGGSDWWPTSDATSTYGGASDSWGESWTSSNINATDFGIAISAKKDTSSGNNVEAKIDYISITVNYTLDITFPTVTNVTSSSANGTYITDDVVHVNVIFNEDVNITGTPTLTLATGTPASTLVNYTSGSGGSTLTFDYTVAAGNTSGDLDYTATNSLIGTIKDDAGNDAVLTLPAPGGAGSLGGNKNIVIDGTKAKTGPNNPATVNEDSIIGTVTWTNENNAKTSNNSYATATLDSDGQITHYLKATDFGYSIPAGATIDGIQVDVERKESGSSLRISDNSVRLVKNGTISGDDKSTGTNWPNSDAYKSYGGPADLWGTTWTADDINNATTGFVISAIHDNTSNSRDLSVDHIRMTVYYTPDITAPTLNPVSIASDNANPAYAKVGDLVTLSFTSSEDIQTPTVMIDGVAADTIAGGPTIWTASRDMTGADTEAVVAFTINYDDLAGNPGLQVTATTDLSSVTFDQTAPDVSFGAVVDPNNISPITITATFTEEVIGFDNNDVDDVDVVVGNGTVTGFTPVSGSVYDIDITPTADGLVTADINAGVATDDAGNPNTAATQLSWTYNSTNPIVTLTTGAAEPTGVAPIPVTATFTEDVEGFTLSDLVIGNGAAGTFVPVSASVYTFEVTPANIGIVTVDVPADVAFDPAANGNLAAAQLSRTFNGVGPTVILTSTNVVSDPTNVSPYNMTATFSQAVTGFDDLNTDTVIVNGNAGNLAGGPTDYTFDVTPSGPGAVTINIPAGAALDGALNPNYASAQFSAAYDITAPSLTAAEMQDVNGDGYADRVVLTFDEVLADTAAGSNGFDVTSAADHGTCDSEDADPNGTATLNLDFNCGTVETSVGDLTVDLTKNAGIADGAGNQVEAFTLTSASVPVAITDNAAPIVASTNPADTETGVRENQDVIVNFSEPMDTTTYSISDTGGTIYGVPVWSNGDRTATFTHAADWAYSTPITVSADADDLAVPALSVNGVLTHDWTFTTWTIHQGAITVPQNYNITDAGDDLSLGVSTAVGPNIFINNLPEVLTDVSSGDLDHDNLTSPEVVGDVGVLPVTAVTLNSTGTIDIQNPAFPGVDVSIPDGTTLFGNASWDGMLYMQAGTGGGNAPSGFSVGNTIVEVGSTGGPLLLDQPATITLIGVTGPATYRPSTSGNWFTVPTCAGTYAAPVPPAPPSPFLACAISDGTDTKIITYHFTAFASLLHVELYGVGLLIPEETNVIMPGEEKVYKDAPFTDIINHWCQDYVNVLYAFNYIEGFNDNTFRPDNNITRKDVAKAIALWRNPDIEECQVDPYKDVKCSNPYGKYISYLQSNNIIGGNSNTYFKPNNSIKRTEALQLLIYIKSLQNTPVNDITNPYIDIKKSDLYYNYVLIAYKLGIISVSSDGLFRPGDFTTRAEFAKMFVEALMR